MGRERGGDGEQRPVLVYPCQQQTLLLVISSRLITDDITLIIRPAMARKNGGGGVATVRETGGDRGPGNCSG